MQNMDRLQLLKKFSSEPRFWWFQHLDYLPALYRNLSEEEFAVLLWWFSETERDGKIGEINVPAMSVINGLIEGNNIDSIVQLGHYAGYSALFIGWALKAMGKARGLFSVDISDEMCMYTQKWMLRAGLGDLVHIECADSTREDLAGLAREYFKQDIKAVIIDSSHQFAHTVGELNYWYRELVPGGFIFLHDISDYSVQYDTTNEGGVNKAMLHWLDENPYAEAIMINETSPKELSPDNPYQDGCGLGIIQKPMTP